MTAATAASPVRHVADDERRARLAVRHGLAPGARFGSVVEATEGITALHATEAASVHLALFGRVTDVTVADVEAALYAERTVVKQGAMRRTLFGFTRDLLPYAVASAGARAARPLVTRLANDLVESGITIDGARWQQDVGDAVVAALGDGDASASELRAKVPELDVSIRRAVGTKWGGHVPVAPQLQWILNPQGPIVRATNGGHWRASKPRYAATETWLGAPLDLPDERTGYAELVRSWLRTFGPGTVADIRWWLGGTVAATRGALADAGAVPVSLEGSDEPGWLLPDDIEPPADAGDWVALLPTLDPTVMGWQERAFYLGPLREHIFDAVGNAGTTAWWRGRIVGAWIQDDTARVRLHLLADVSPAAQRMLADEADRLTSWLDGVRIPRIFSPAMAAAAAKL
jgi:hypothetical protein